MASSEAPALHLGGHPLTGIVDIGKTHTRLMLIDSVGELVHERSTDSRAVPGALGYDALDVATTEAWLCEQLAGLGTLARHLRHLTVSAHGAAVAALRGSELALPVADYEWAGFDDRPATLAAQLDPFEATGSPLLPRGLNMGVQLEWLSRHAADELAAADTLLPYGQYWTHWLSGVASSELSALGCHTLLWRPREKTFSDWARHRGWAQKFAPLKPAWATLGPLRVELATRLGVPRSVMVHTGVHDSNACLARYLHHWPRLTLVSTGTWVVVMAPGAAQRPLDATQDQLANVSVRGEFVPTARFMGGRELAVVCAGADPAAASLDRLPALLARGLRVLPAFSDQGGPFSGQSGCLAIDGRTLDNAGWLATLPVEADRATAAAWYAAQMCAWLIEHLGATGPVVVEGPYAHNPVILAALQTLLGREVLHSLDEVEGTARGSWRLCHWTDPVSDAPRTAPISQPAWNASLLQAAHRHWLAQLPGQD